VLRNLWTISIAANLVSVVIGWVRGYRIWSVWATFYLLSALALRYVDWRHLYGSGGYVNLWIAQQLWSAVLLIFVVREVVKPTQLLAVICSGAAFGVGMVAVQAAHWKHSPVEFVMWFFGMVALALGLVCAAGRPRPHGLILTGFLLLYAILMLAGADYLSSANLGIAWSILEIVAFAAWAISHLRRTET